MAAKKQAPAKKAPPKKAAKPATPKEQTVTQPAKAKKRGKVSREMVFVEEYLVDLKGKDAAIRAGYSPVSARIRASELLAKPHIQEAVAKGMVERSRRVEIRGDEVVNRLWEMATTDERELTELHRTCCRFCYGKDHRYQFTPNELELEREAWAKRVADAKEGDDVAPFDEKGGIGWDPRRDPSQDCPECHGYGVERVIFKDTRDLSPGARMLFAGVKVTQNGMQMLTHDKKSALIDVGRHLGLFKDKLEVTMPTDFEAQMLAARKRALGGKGG